MNQIINNVEFLLTRLGDLSDFQLLLVYWQQFDDVKMDKENISTKDFLHGATDTIAILDAKRLIKIMKEEEKC